MNNIDILEEKEKKAINNLNFIVVTDIYDNEVRIDKTKIINEYNESVGIVLNLVSNLIAENKELKEMLKHRIEYTNKLEKDLFENCSNYVVSKDKIKAKIEEYEQDVKDFEEYWSKDPRKFKKEKSVDYYKLEALQSLLEKE